MKDKKEHLGGDRGQPGVQQDVAGSVGLSAHDRAQF